MKEFTGVYLTDGVSQSGVRFPIASLEEALRQGYNKCVPSNLSHDIHRPLGVTRVTSLFFSHEATYLLGRTSIPETEEEFRLVMNARTNYLNEKMVSRVLQYSQGFNEELSHLGLLMEGGVLTSNGVVMYGYTDIVWKAFPHLKNRTDGDGLFYLNDLYKDFNYKGDGVFSSKNNNLSILVHPYLRRSLSRYNCYNNGFLQELFDANSENTPVRIRIDLDFVGYTPSYIDTHEFDYWYGPAYSDDISKIRVGVTTYHTNPTEYAFNQIKKTEFVWQVKDGKRQFEMEEVTDVDAPTLPEGTYGCRYLHSFYDVKTGVFEHFDGAIRSYDIDAICERLTKPIDAMGHSATYTKLFRIDGQVPLHKWKSLITHYLKGNQDVYRYFGEDAPFILEQSDAINSLAKYVPFILKPGDGVRLLYSYHPLEQIDIERCFMDFDTCNLPEGVVETTDLLSVDLTKCIRKAGGKIDYPNCRFISYRDNFHNLPEIYHGVEDPVDAIAMTIAGVKLLLDGLNNNGIDDCLSFCLSWNMDDTKVKLSIMGAVSDLVEWLKAISKIPVGRADMQKWLEEQSGYIKKNGADTSSPVNMRFIHPNGIFYHRRRLIQEDTELKDMFVDEEKGLCASIDFPEHNQELAKLLNKGVIRQASFVVVGQLIDENGLDYLQSDKIAILNEISYTPTIHFMNLVWASKENALTNLIVL